MNRQRVPFFRRMHREDRGFTLVELLVVIAILGVLAAIAIPVVASRIDQARESANLANIRQLQAAVDLYKLDTGEYPSGNNPSATGGDYLEWQDTLLSDEPPGDPADYPDFDGPYLRGPVLAPSGYLEYRIDDNVISNGKVSN